MIKPSNRWLGSRHQSEVIMEKVLHDVIGNVTAKSKKIIKGNF